MKISKTFFAFIIAITFILCTSQMCSSKNETTTADIDRHEYLRLIPDSIIKDLPVNPAMTLVRNMGIGINIGNTLDATSGFENPYWHSGENGWGNPSITREFIRALKNHGYESIRLPVTWKDFMGGAPDYLVGACQRPGGCNNNPPCPPNRMDRVEQVVKWILEEDMYCVLNVHHDDWIYGASTNQAAVTDRFVKLWTQIATRFANVSQEKLIFESMNEIGFDDLWNQRSPGSGKNQAFDILNSLNQAFVNTVRAIPGNANRFLLIAGYWTNIAHTCDPLFKMPTDTIRDRLIVSVHYYDPSTFCIAEERNNSWGFRDTWGTIVDYQELVREYDRLRTTFLEKGVPVIMGEYGVTLINKVEEDRIRWMAAVKQISLNYGICPMLWDTGWRIENGRHSGGEISRNSPFAMRDSLKTVWEIVNKP
ncbi:MAG: glycoside hydrolase family 5 protein [Treponema sp.]|nr:glycoside hydrolase family 5 protein [Treponema sp.]